MSRITTDGPIQFWYPAGPQIPNAEGGAGPGAGYNLPLPGAGSYWARGGPVAAGSPAYGQISCFTGPDGSTANAVVDIAPMPGVPTSYSGSIPPQGQSSQYFLPPGPGPYEAKITVAQGAVEAAVELGQGDFSTTPPPRQVVTTAGTLRFTVGTVAPAAVTLTGLDGPPAPWSLQLKALPVAVLGPTVAPRAISEGQRATIAYTTDYATRLDAFILARDGGLIRTLAEGLSVRPGSHTLLWDGLAKSGAAVPDGIYEIRMSFRDNTEQPTLKSTEIAIDTRPPTIIERNKSTIGANRAIVFAVRDATAGIRRARLLVNGRTVDRLSATEPNLLYRPGGGWKRRSRQNVLVIAEDRAGNIKTVRRSVHIR